MNFVHTHTRRIFAGLIITTALALITPGGVHAQGTITPSPAPSKTPSQPTATLMPSLVPSSPIVEPRTQADLQILTGNVQRPNGIVWFNNKLYTACSGDFTIYEIDAVSAATRTYIWGVRNAHTLYAETSGNELVLWAPDFQENKLVRVDRNGVDAIAEDLADPWGIAYLNENEFLISSLRSNSLFRVNRDGTSQEIAADLRSPTGVVVDGDYVYVANTGSARRAIVWLQASDLSRNSNDALEAATLVTGLQNTTGMTLAPDGFLYFAYSLGTRGVVGRVDPNLCRQEGGCTNENVEIVLFTELAAPLAGLTISPDMRLFVHTMFSPDIYWLDLNGEDEPNDD